MKHYFQMLLGDREAMAQLNDRLDKLEALQWPLYIIFFLAFFTLLLPLLLNNFPLCADYPNHLARVFILYHPDNVFLRNIFEINFNIIPNIGLDLLAAAIRPLGVSPNSAMKLIFIFSCVLLWSGLVAFCRAVHGRLMISSLLVLPVSYSFVIAHGFFNFLIGIGVFFWVFAWFIRSQLSFIKKILITNFVGALIFFCHLGALIIMILSLFLYEIGQGQTWARSGRTAAAGSVFPLLLFIFRDRNHFPSIEFKSILEKIIGVIYLFQVSSLGDAILKAAIFCVLFILLYKVRALSLRNQWTPLVFGLGTVSVLAPFDLQASYFVDWRLIWIALLFFLLLMDIDAQRRKWISPTIVGLVLYSIAMDASHLLANTRDYNRDIVDFINSMNKIPENSFVFVSSYERPVCPDEASGNEGRSPDEDGLKSRNHIPLMFYEHVPSLLTPFRNSVIPYIFAHPGAAAVHFREAFSQYFSAIPRGPADSLMAAYLVTGETIPLGWKENRLNNGSYVTPLLLSPFMEGWDRRFSYVIHLQKDCPELGPYSALFPEIARGNFFSIFKISRNSFLPKR